ncbi:hypothetical protein IFM89_033295 [Coptis chinensis]|uniref:Uncharacterized protein n=1 Tax=Coptis chinensis TaxID=261450 RepID=A0A835HRJ4_9MAGN|nr:hypothetical protein IFM89_033295 [Coptis chinensis]
MKVRPWFPICSSVSCTNSTCDATTDPAPPQKTTPYRSSKLLYSDSSFSSTITLESNLSLQTLPSVPSLQNTLLDHTSPNIFLSYHCLFSFKPQTWPVIVSCLAISGKLLYAASGNEINVFDLTNYTHLDSFSSSSGSVKSLAFSKDGKVFTAHQDCKIRVWFHTSPTKRHQQHQHQLIATLPTVQDRLHRFVLPTNYVSIRRHKKRLWIDHVDAVSGLEVSNGLIYSVSWDKYLKIWSSKDLVCLESVKAHEDAVNALVVSKEGTVYTGSADTRIRVWAKAAVSFGDNKKQKRQRHRLIATLEKHKSAVNALAISHDGSVLFSGACDRSILVWEREHSAHHMVVTGALRGHRGAILCLVNIVGPSSLSSSSDLLISGSADRTIRIWQRCIRDSSSSSSSSRYFCLNVMEGHEKPVKSLVAVSQEEGGFSVCSGSLDGEIKVWRVSFSNQKINSTVVCT